MRVEEFARTILFGTRLFEDKLIEASSELSPDRFVSEAPEALTEIPDFPGRPANLAKPGKAVFPAIAGLHRPETRGEVLHFFANHELLAMELMALLLLRFPEAPSEFRLGIARTIQEEQSHLRLYLSRMKELGVEFGSLPVSDYFWKNMRGMKSPMDFVIQMSLTFEQANLDFSLYFMKAVKAAGDEKTAEILERVYREEIGHVKHGLAWFNRWRPSAPPESDWSAYRRLLPEPMTPRRAKGFEFSRESRKKAGLSEEFIRELALCTGSKGRPPVVWSYNPHCDREISRGKPGFSATEGARRLSQDLECIPAFLAMDQDLVLVSELPNAAWIESLQKAGFKTPEFSTRVRAPKVGGVEPWGWSPDSFEKFRPFKDKIVCMDGGNGVWASGILSKQSFNETGLGDLYSKVWSVRFLTQWLNENPRAQSFFGEPKWVGRCYSQVAECQTRTLELLLEGQAVILKAPYGTAGMQVKEVRKAAELEGSKISGWIEKVISEQGQIIVEQRLNKVADLSIQMEIKSDRTRVFEARRFFTGSRNDYRGSYLGVRGSFSPEESRFLHEAQPSWQKLLKDLAQTLRDNGYEGASGVDALLWRDQAGSLKLKPLVELNPRWTMGRVALRLEQRLAPGVVGIWGFVSVKEILARGFKTLEDFTSRMESRCPLELVQAGGGERISSGVVFTNDPKRAREVLTVFVAFTSEKAPSIQGDLTSMILAAATSTNPLSVSFSAGTTGKLK